MFHRPALATRYLPIPSTRWTRTTDLANGESGSGCRVAFVNPHRGNEINPFREGKFDKRISGNVGESPAVSVIWLTREFQLEINISAVTMKMRSRWGNVKATISSETNRVKRTQFLAVVCLVSKRFAHCFYWMTLQRFQWSQLNAIADVNSTSRYPTL